MTPAPAVHSLVIAVRCHFCSRQLPAFRTHQIADAQTICDDCIEWHNKALEFLAGAPPPGCQACGATWEFLRDSTPGAEVRMYVVPADGIYQIRCATCIRGYLPKRRDLYRETPFGARALKIWPRRGNLWVI